MKPDSRKIKRFLCFNFNAEIRLSKNGLKINKQGEKKTNSMK